jgi:hypothetical protein
VKVAGRGLFKVMSHDFSGRTEEAHDKKPRQDSRLPG